MEVGSSCRVGPAPYWPERHSGRRGARRASSQHPSPSQPICKTGRVVAMAVWLGTTTKFAPTPNPGMSKTAGCCLIPISVSRYCHPPDVALGLFLLPGGRPSRFGADAVCIQIWGLPRRLTRPSARRSITAIASSIYPRSCRSSASIFRTSISESYRDQKTETAYQLSSWSKTDGPSRPLGCHSKLYECNWKGARGLSCASLARECRGGLALLADALMLP